MGLKHGLWTILKNADDQHVADLLRSFIYLLFETGRWCNEVPETLFAIFDEFQAGLSSVLSERRQIQAARTVSDDKIFAFVGHPIGWLVTSPQFQKATARVRERTADVTVDWHDPAAVLNAVVKWCQVSAAVVDELSAMWLENAAFKNRRALDMAVLQLKHSAEGPVRRAVQFLRRVRYWLFYASLAAKRDRFGQLVRQISRKTGFDVPASLLVRNMKRLAHSLWQRVHTRADNRVGKRLDLPEHFLQFIDSQPHTRRRCLRRQGRFTAHDFRLHLGQKLSVAGQAFQRTLRFREFRGQTRMNELCITGAANSLGKLIVKQGKVFLERSCCELLFRVTFDGLLHPTQFGKTCLKVSHASFDLRPRVFMQGVEIDLAAA